MAFNAGQYMKAAARQQRVTGALQKGASKAASQQIQGQSFGLDEQVKYASKQKKAGSVFGNWKKGLGLLGGLAAMAIGAPWLLAAGMAGGSTFLGGKIGKKKAKQELDESKFFKGQTGEMMDYMDKDITKSTLMSAAMAAGGAHVRDLQATKAAGEIPSEFLTDPKSIEGWINPETGLQGSVQEYDALVKARQATYTAGGDLAPEHTGTMFDPSKHTPQWSEQDMGIDMSTGGSEIKTTDVYSPLRGETAKVPVPSRELPSPQDYMPADPTFAQRGMQNLGYTGKGVLDYGKRFIGNQFKTNTSLYDFVNKVNTASSIYGAIK